MKLSPGICIKAKAKPGKWALQQQKLQSCVGEQKDTSSDLKKK
jgi:hypothetical protein